MTYYFATETLEIGVENVGEEGWSVLLSEIDKGIPWHKWRHWEAIAHSKQEAIMRAVNKRAWDIGDAGHSSTTDLGYALIELHKMIFGGDE